MVMLPPLSCSFLLALLPTTVLAAGNATAKETGRLSLEFSPSREISSYYNITAHPTLCPCGGRSDKSSLIPRTEFPLAVHP
jgi:hypothetical protein